MVRIAVFGGSGFVGTNFCILAKERGYEPIVYDNFERKGSNRNAAILSQKYGIQIEHLDVRSEESFDSLPKNIDALVNFAGQPGIPRSLAEPRFDFEVNALGTLNVLEYSRTHGKIPVLFASTNKVYSDAINNVSLIEEKTRYKIERGSWDVGVTTRGFSEQFPMDSAGEHPHSPYGVSKASADLMCQEWYHAFGVPTVVFRMSCIYGLYQNGVSEQGWTDWFIRQRILGDNKLVFYGNGKQVRDCLFGTDAAEAYLTALEKIDIAKGHVFNLGGGKFNSSLIEWVDILNTYPAEQAMQITYADWRMADHKYYVSNTHKIESLLGWKAKVTIPEGIDQMVKAYQGDFYTL